MLIAKDCSCILYVFWLIIYFNENIYKCLRKFTMMYAYTHAGALFIYFSILRLIDSTYVKDFRGKSHFSLVISTRRQNRFQSSRFVYTKKLLHILAYMWCNQAGQDISDPASLHLTQWRRIHAPGWSFAKWLRENRKNNRGLWTHDPPRKMRTSFIRHNVCNLRF